MGSAPNQRVPHKAGPASAKAHLQTFRADGAGFPGAAARSQSQGVYSGPAHKGKQQRARDALADDDSREYSAGAMPASAGSFTSIDDVFATPSAPVGGGIAPRFSATGGSAAGGVALEDGGDYSGARGATYSRKSVGGTGNKKSRQG